jgi:hypothetical protein
MQKGIHHKEIFSPVVSWSTICLFLKSSVIHKWRTIQLDLVMAYTNQNSVTYLHGATQRFNLQDIEL